MATTFGGPVRRDAVSGEQREVWFRLEQPAGGFGPWHHQLVTSAVWSRLLEMDADCVAQVRTTDPAPRPTLGGYSQDEIDAHEAR